jgi:hypothetical protein
MRSVRCARSWALNGFQAQLSSLVDKLDADNGHDIERPVPQFAPVKPACVKGAFEWVLQTMLRPKKVKSFVVLPKRWSVKRTFGWLGGMPHRATQ